MTLRDESSIYKLLYDFSGSLLSPEKRDPALNFFKVNASQPLSLWRQKGWIHPDDPRGWFQWYCRYYLGRRLPGEDDRQIKRWLAIKRHLSQVKANCAPGEKSCRPRQRQALPQRRQDGELGRL